MCGLNSVKSCPFFWVTPLGGFVVLASLWSASFFPFILFLAAPQLFCLCSPGGIICLLLIHSTPPSSLGTSPPFHQNAMSGVSFCETLKQTESHSILSLHCHAEGWVRTYCFINTTLIVRWGGVIVYKPHKHTQMRKPEHLSVNSLKRGCLFTSLSSLHAGAFASLVFFFFLSLPWKNTDSLCPHHVP